MKIYNDFNTSVQKALSEIDSDWMNYDGVIVCGTHTPFNPEIIIDEIKKAREENIPFLGICFGHQLAWIEYCRNVLGIPNATSEEWGTGNWVVKKRKELKVGLHEGETWWSNFECTEDKWDKNDNFISVPYHPEYQSSKENPHPLLVKFLQLCK